MLIDSFKKFWRFVKRNLLKIVIAPSPRYFIVLMLISYNHFYVTNCTNTLCCVDVLVFIFLLSFNLLRKRKNDPCLKIILTSIAFLVCILYRFSKPHNKLKSCFTFQFFTHDTIEITNEVNTSHSQSELSIFVISKFRFKNDNSFCLLLLLLSDDISLNPGHFSNP